jgi:hypothetical protein
MTLNIICDQISQIINKNDANTGNTMGLNDYDELSFKTNEFNLPE